MSLPRTLIAVILVAYGVLFYCMPIVGAPIQPFEAVVKPNGHEDVFARSGPGKQYYPTQKLKEGDRVVVIRKDPGGWFVIEPPAGSFTWILAENVNRNGNRGVVNSNQSVTRVGSQINPAQRDVEQVRLNKGDVVEILGEDSFDLKGRGSEVWLKIRSPKGERRWIKGSQVVELNPDGTPKLVPRSIRTEDNRINDELASGASLGPIAEDDLTFAPSTAKAVEPQRKSRSSPTSDPLEEAPQDTFDSLSPSESALLAAQRQFHLIDAELDDMLEQPAYHWRLSGPQQEFLRMRQSTTDPQLIGMIDARLRKIEKYQVIQNDARTMAARYPQLQRQPPKYPTGSPSKGPAPDTTSGSNPRPAGSRFEGAGIIYKLRNPAPGTPQFVLIAPDRRILCYLESTPSLDLERHIGQSVGLNGRRVYDAQLRADRLLISSLTLVRLIR